jgi:hypothetical protein
VALVEVRRPLSGVEFTPNLVGGSALDILHVACALILRADTFLTFDKRQAKLARAAGLSVAPNTP